LADRGQGKGVKFPLPIGEMIKVRGQREMIVLALILALIALSLILWIFRYYAISLLYYLLVRFERRKIDFQLLGSLRDDLVHERKKKIAGLEMILSSWEKGEEVQPRYEYFEDLFGQLKNLVLEQRRNLMAVTRDILLWGKLWNILRRVEKTSSEKREKSDIPKLRRDLTLFQNVIDEAVEDATKKFSFTLNEVIKESVKIVRIEKSRLKNIEIAEQLDDLGDTVRFSYDRFKEWQRVLTNLIRNAIEAVEAKKAGASGLGLVGADFSLRGGEEIGWVKISTKLTETDTGRARVPDLRKNDALSSVGRAPSPAKKVSVVIEDSGIGMDEATKASFYKKGFTSGKEGGLGLGVSEESVQFINQYGNWQIESQKGVGTKITINIDREKAEEAELILPEPKPFFRTRLAFALSLFLLALIGLALLFAFHKYSRFWEDWNPAFVKLQDENTVVVETKDGRFLWNQKFAQKIRESSIAIGDINRDGMNEVLIGTLCGFKETGCIYCFSSSGRELWRFALGAEDIFGCPSHLYKANKIVIRDLNLDGEIEIVVDGGNYPWFPSQIAILDEHGQMISSYWHCGIVFVLSCVDINNDDVPEILFGGTNNRLTFSAVVGILDYKTTHGQSPPYNDPVLPRAQERAYIKFPFVKELGGENRKSPSVREFSYTGKEYGREVYRAIIVDDYRGFYREFWLDASLTNVLRIVVPPDSKYLWMKLKKEGIVDYDLTPEVIESWKEIEVWKNGKKVK